VRPSNAQDHPTEHDGASADVGPHPHPNPHGHLGDHRTPIQRTKSHASRRSARLTITAAVVEDVVGCDCGRHAGSWALGESVGPQTHGRGFDPRVGLRQGRLSRWAVLMGPLRAVERLPKPLHTAVSWVGAELRSRQPAPAPSRQRLARSARRCPPPPEVERPRPRAPSVAEHRLVAEVGQGGTPTAQGDRAQPG